MLMTFFLTAIAAFTGYDNLHVFVSPLVNDFFFINSGQIERSLSRTINYIIVIQHRFIQSFFSGAFFFGHSSLLIVNGF